uniref:NADH-ubiquinone oxidoreductase chain 5 n=1 Tax=Macrosaldula sp. PJ-2017 TaxID=2021942 RepID=A0A343ISD2_9HEMI|nr:NADH dehydrogenase subunit 5 [Macrosaldula sp. PJ-2017]AST10157.1 NADH dehydrogenase subunit 5 [Macrosaldula sp. PJ-2017]
MNNLFLYKLSSFFLFISGGFIFTISLFFLGFDYCLLMDWEILTINSCALVMTIIFDWMSLMFMSCVLLISSMVVLYSFSYMSSDLNNKRFLFLVLMFIFSMMFMILSPNLISILLGWDGLGLVSYGLVIYFQNWKSYNAGMLTILTNRIGDVAILISICWMLNFGSWNFLYYMTLTDFWMYYLLFLLILASFTKSAQIPFSSWLPAAMAAPTPVSALVHSSTLVTAGVYLMIRFSSLLTFIDCSFFVLIGLLTMFMSGVGAMFEFDLKKIIALSTLSQLGLMMSILFLGYPLMAFFHLLTHAFFKALLFLCAGLIIHVMGDSQDIRHMGSSVVYLPFTCTCFCISSLSLCGFPFLSGFYSKDLILETLVINSYNSFLYILFLLSVGLTAAYSFRLIYYCISGGTNLHVCHSYSEDFFMSFSMIFLTIMAIVSGSFISWLIYPAPSLIIMPVFLKFMPLFFVILGLYIGYEVSICNLSESINSFKNYFICYFLGSMWFMPFFSTYMLYSFGYFMSKNYSCNIDSGWGEYIVSMSSYNVFFFLSKINYYYQFNNFKLYLISFLLLMSLMII